MIDFPQLKLIQSVSQPVVQCESGGIKVKFKVQRERETDREGERKREGERRKTITISS